MTLGLNIIESKSHRETMMTLRKSTNWHIKCGRFDKIIPDLDYERRANSKIRRISSTPPSKLKENSFILIATNGKEIYEKSRCLDARDYISELEEKDKKKLIVLTQKEKYLLFDIEVELNCRVNCFELSFPLFEDIKHFSDPKKRIAHMKKCFLWLHRKGIYTSSIGKHFSIKNQHKVARKIRFKNNLDRWFAFSNQAGIQEVFKTHEFREDRAIIALDYNSMYPSCMEGHFPDPRRLKYYNYKGKNVSIDEIPVGLYKVYLCGFISNSFKNIHPFKYKTIDSKLAFKGSEETTIECLLHSSEIHAYKKYFKHIKIIEGVASQNTINHPLQKHAKKIFNQFTNYKKQGSTKQANLLKKELQYLYSATSQKNYKTIFLKDYDEISNFLLNNFYININECKDYNQFKKIINNSQISATQCKDVIKVNYIDYDSDFNLYSLASQVISNARVKMIKTIEYIMDFEDSEICYTNTDSIHVSVRKRDLAKFMQYLSPFISDGMGDLKVQCIAEKGLWLDIGRYWLINKDKVELYKNITFNHDMNNDPFTRFRKIKMAHYAQAFSYVSSHAFTIEKSLSFTKKLAFPEKLDHSNLVRYDLNAISNRNVAGETLFCEERKSKEAKLELFRKVATS